MSRHGQVLCRVCGDWIGSYRYGTQVLCRECGATRIRLYERAYRAANGRWRGNPKRRHMRTRPIVPPREPLTDEEILEGVRIGREQPIIKRHIWDMVDLATFGTEAWKMPTERDELQDGELP